MSSKPNLLQPFLENKNAVSCLLEDELHSLTLTYRVYSENRDIKWNQNSDIKLRKTALWENTCLELFVKRVDSSAYYEFNFSPEGHWNCFYFDAPGSALCEADVKVSPEISNVEYGHLSITIPKSCFARDFWENGEMRLNLAAVTENTKGELCYWALAHKKEKPDFHDFSAFILQV